MIVTIIRHGKAGDARRDADRELTDHGIDDISFGSRRLRDLCTDKSLSFPSQIFHSNWRRTTQTAAIIEAAFTASIEPMDALLPGSTLTDVDSALSQLPTGDGHCVLVGHQPMVSTLVDYYLGAPGRVPSLTPGGLVSLRVDVPARACAELLFWALPPEYRGDV